MRACHSLLRLGVATALVGLAAAASAQETVALRFSQFTPSSHFYHQKILLPWQKEVDEATQGRVKIEFTTAPLGPFPRNFDMAVQGVADVTAGNHGVSPGRFRVTQMVENPMVATARIESVSAALWRTHEKHLAKADEHKGTQLLTLHVSGSVHFFSTGKPIKTPDDFKSLKFIANSETTVKVAERLGMVPVLKPVTEYYDVVSKGTVDGMFGTNTSVKGWRVEEFMKHQLKIPGGGLYGTFFLVVNQKKWDTIKKDDQAAIMKASGERYAVRAGRVFQEEDDKAEAERKARGATVETMSDPKMIEAVSKAFSFIDEVWIDSANKAGINGQEALAFFRNEVKDYK